MTGYTNYNGGIKTQVVLPEKFKKVNVRKEAESNSTIIATLTNSADVILLTSNTEWSKILLNGDGEAIKGFIKTEFIKELE